MATDAADGRPHPLDVGVREERSDDQHPIVGQRRLDRRDDEVAGQGTPVDVSARHDCLHVEVGAERALDPGEHCEMQLVVGGRDDGAGHEVVVDASALLDESADVHRDVRDLVLVDADAAAGLQLVGDVDSELVGEWVSGLDGAGERIAGERQVLGACHQVAHVQREPGEELVVVEVDEEFAAGSHGDASQFGEVVGAEQVGLAGVGSGLGRCGNPGLDEVAEVGEVLSAQPHVEVPQDEGVDDRGDALVRIRQSRTVTIGLQGVIPTHPIDGDGDVQQHVAETVLVHGSAAGGQCGDEIGLELGKSVGGELALDGSELQHSAGGLLAEEGAEQASTGRFGSVEHEGSAGATQGQTGSVQTAAHAGEVALQCRLADMERCRRREDVQPVGGVDESAEQPGRPGGRTAGLLGT